MIQDSVVQLWPEAPLSRYGPEESYFALHRNHLTDVAAHADAMLRSRPHVPV